MTNLWKADNGDGTYTNPILYTDYSDPDAIRVGEDYYMVASSFSNTPALPLLHSKDLVNWELINYICEEVPGERYAKPIHGCGVWAPSIRYHEGTFFVCFPMPDEGIYMSITTNPYGKWTEPVNIRPGSGWIDPCPFWDDDGKAYLVAGVAKSRIGYKSVLHMVEMQPDGLGLLDEEIKVFDGNFNDQETIEGPKLYKRNGWYYIFAPAGGVKTGWQTVLRSRNIYGPYEYKVVMNQGDSPINGPHQGAWVDTVTGEDWFIHFQDVYAAGRITHLQPMRWENDWPVIGEATPGEDCGHPVMRWSKPNVGAAGHSDSIVGSNAENMEDISQPDNDIISTEVTDFFANNKLPLDWQWNANYSAEWFSFDHAMPGLKLKAIKKQGVYGDAPNLLLRKWEAPEFEVTVHLDLTNLQHGDEAGFISMGMKYGLLTFKKDSEEKKILIQNVLGQQLFGKILAEDTREEKTSIGLIEADTGTVYIKYLVERIGRQDLNSKERDFPLEKVSIYYSENGYDYQEGLSMEAVPGRWVGVKYGIFCLAEKENSKGYAVVKRSSVKMLSKA